MSSEKGSLNWGMAAILLPVIYVLSLGPACLIVKHNRALGDSLAIIYYPVGWLHDHTPLKRPLEMYVHFWGD
jgi:hypothetical protein